MKKKFVISNTPTRLPFSSTILYVFLMYYFNVSGIWWGIFITIFTILWIGGITNKAYEVNVDLNDNDPKNATKRSAFAMKLDELSRKKHTNQ